MPDQNISIGVDSAAAVAGINQITSAINSQNKSIENIAVTMAAFNKVGKLQQVIVSGLVDGQDQLDIRLKNTKKGFEAQGAILSKTTKAVRELAAAQKQLDQTNFAKKLGNINQLGLPTDVQVDPSKLKAFQQKISEIAFSGNIKGGEISKIFTDLKNGVDTVEVGIRGKLQNALKGVIDLFKKARVEQEKLAKIATVGQQTRNLFPVPSSASITQLRGYEIAISNIQRLVEKGKVDIADFNRILSGVKSGTIGPADVKGEGQAKLLSNLIAISKAFGDNERAAKKFTLTAKDLFRIAEATVFKNILGAITSEFANGIRAAADYQIIISQIRTISQDNQLSFQQWSDGIRQVSDLFGLSQADVAQAAYDAVSNQVVKGAEAFKFLASAAELARVSQSSLTDTQNILSSVINSYNLSIADTDEISAQLFKTVDLGRIKLSEIANTIGRTTFLGNALGVTFQEIEASLATLTIQGVRTSEAETFLTNVFQKLLKPTDAAKKLLASFGVSSGEAAVKTFGFAGTIEKLFNAFKEGDAEAGDFFNEIRGRKGFEGLTNFAGLFEKNLGKISNATKDYAAAKRIRAESPADFLTKEFNQIRNVFVNDIGQEIIGQTAKFVEAVKPFVPSFKLITTTVTTAAAALTAYQVVMIGGRAATLGAAAATGVYNAVTASSIGFTQRLTLARAELNTALTAGQFGILAAGTAVGFYAGQFLFAQKSIGEANEAIKQLDEENKNFIKNAAGDAVANRFKQTIDASNKGFQNILQTLARVDVAISNSLDGTAGRISGITESLNEQFNTYEDNMKAGQSRLQSIITQGKGEIEKSVRFVQSLKDTASGNLFQAQLQFATPQQQFELTAKKIKELKAEAEELFVAIPRKGAETDAQFAERQEQEQERRAAGRAKLNEALTLANQNFSRGIELEKEQLRQQGFSGELVVQTTELKKQQNDIVRIALDLEKQVTAEQTKRIERAEQLKTAEAARADTIKKAFKDFSDFSITNKDGNVKSEFTEKVSGKVSPDLIEGEFQRRADKLTAAIGNDANAQIALLQLVEQKKTAIVAQAEQLRAKLILEGAKRQIEQQKAAGEAEIKALKEKERVALDSVDPSRTRINNLLAQVDQFQNNIRPILPGAFGRNIDLSGSQGTNVTVALANAKKSLDDVRRNASVGPDGERVPRVEDVEKLKKDIVSLKANIGNLAQKAGIGNLTDSRIAEGVDVTFGQVFETLDKELANLQGVKFTIEDARIGIQAYTLQLDKLNQNPALKSLTVQFPEVQKAGETATQSLQTGFNGTLDSVNKVNNALETLKKRLGDLGVGGKLAAEGGALGFATGGRIPGGPRGTDIIPAWLSPGEYVVNARSAAKFSPILEAINKSPKYLAQGGPVTTTNVGDINIHLSGESVNNPSNFAVKAGKELRRAIKQGRVQL